MCICRVPLAPLTGISNYPTAKIILCVANLAYGLLPLFILWLLAQAVSYRRSAAYVHVYTDITSGRYTVISILSLLLALLLPAAISVVVITRLDIDTKLVDIYTCTIVMNCWCSILMHQSIYMAPEQIVCTYTFAYGVAGWIFMTCFFPVKLINFRA